MSDEATPSRLQALQAEVSELRARLDNLSAQLEQLHGQRTATLKTQLRCPACNGRRALHASEVLDRTQGTQHRLAVTTVGFWAPEPKGGFECYVCLQCGFAEWYVKDPQEVPTNKTTLRIIETDDASTGPYR